ncbi:MAG: MerR family transcriptional regulator [Acidobacteria bacterium]|nr:MerR family transcriptional regulator [Acidobacteriota bacterium]
MVTVSTLARRCGLSRTTVLYYESIGLLAPAHRSPSNYRYYGEREVERMRRIRAYRDAGLALTDIRVLLDRTGQDAATVLSRRIVELDAEIARLREHQRAIARLLPGTGVAGRDEMISKEKWVEIMRGAGFTDEDMGRWHAEFERSAPAEHQEFLQFLRIPAEEITKIREWSRTEAAR